MDNLESIGRIYLTFRGEGGISGYDQRSIGLGVREGCQTPPWSLLLHPSVFLMPTDAALYQCSSSTLIEYSQTYIISNTDPICMYQVSLNLPMRDITPTYLCYLHSLSFGQVQWSLLCSTLLIYALFLHKCSPKIFTNNFSSHKLSIKHPFNISNFFLSAISNISPQMLFVCYYKLFCMFVIIGICLLLLSFAVILYGSAEHGKCEVKMFVSISVNVVVDLFRRLSA